MIYIQHLNVNHSKFTFQYPPLQLLGFKEQLTIYRIITRVLYSGPQEIIPRTDQKWFLQATPWNRETSFDSRVT